MTTQLWSTRLRHDSDAMFREWGAEFATKLAAVGLVQTSDTGQINWTTVTRAGLSSNAGYEIWRFNDTIQATAPIFIRIDYGTGSNTSAPRMNFTVGTGSNGSGTITGTALSTARTVSNGTSAENSDTARVSYMCGAEGFFGFLWKFGASGNSSGFFQICRTCDSAGAPDATGALVIWYQAAISAQAFRYASTAVAYTVRTTSQTAQLCLWPQSPTSSAVGADVQAALAWTITPRVAPLFGLCGVLDAELPLGTTFSTTLVGSTPRTYIAMASNLNTMDFNSQLKPAILWE